MKSFPGIKLLLHFILKSRYFAAVFYLFLISPSTFSGSLQTDTITLTLTQAENIFLEKNLQLLAQKCNVDAAHAQVLQNRLWDNPNITVNQNVFNTESATNGAGKWFPLSDNGETNVQFQQLITLAGKRNKRIGLGRLTAQKTEFLFYDLLRTLKFQLRSDFYKLYFTQQTLNVYAQEIASMTMLIKAFEDQFQKGHVSKRDVLRLKASLFSLENEKCALDNQRIDTQTDLTVLLRLDNAFIRPNVDMNSLDSIKIAGVTFQNLIDTALADRNDLKAAEADLKYNELNLEYQKALAIPDFQLIAGWDKNGSYVHNYNYLGIQVDVPIFNRNQGNIKSAMSAFQGSRYACEAARNQVVSDVSNAYAKALQCDSLFRALDRSFFADFSSMREEVLKNYEKRNIGLLEFLDFYDAYKQNAVQYYAMLNNRVNAFESGSSNFNISDTVMNMISIDTAKISPVENELTITGKICFNEDEVVRVYPLVSGLASEVKVSRGDYVKKGQELAIIISAEATGIRNDLLNAQSNLEIAKKALAAAEDMYKSGIASEKEYLTAQSDYRKAESELTRVNDIVKINGNNSTANYVIRAPVSGYVVERFINPHMQIRPDNGNTLFTISDLNHVWVLANVYETDIAKVHAGDEVMVNTIAYPDIDFKGKIDRISTVLYPDNKTMKIRIDLKNPNAMLKPEMFANVVVKYAGGGSMLEVPSNALIFDKSRNFVILYNNRRDVQTREVQVFSVVGKRTYISAGLKPGDRVISKCQLLIYSAINES